MSASVADDKTLRSISISFAGPVEAGALDCETALLREGKSATFVQANVTQAGTVRATASATYGRTRHSSVPIDGPARPEAPSPESVDSMPYMHGVTPRFTQWLDIKYVTGTYPFMGSTTSKLGVRAQAGPEPNGRVSR